MNELNEYVEWILKKTMGRFTSPYPSCRASRHPLLSADRGGLDSLRVSNSTWTLSRCGFGTSVGCPTCVQWVTLHVARAKCCIFPHNCSSLGAKCYVLHTTLTVGSAFCVPWTKGALWYLLHFWGGLCWGFGILLWLSALCFHSKKKVYSVWCVSYIYIYRYIYIYVFICMCRYIDIYIYVCIYIYIYLYICIYIYVCVPLTVHMYLHWCMYICIYVSLYVYICIYFFSHHECFWSSGNQV